MFTVMYHSLLVGASLFVPVPFLDDKLASFFWRHMVADLAKLHQRRLTKEQIQAFSHDSRFALSDGCLFVGKRFFRELFQEILFFLEWRRAIDLATDAYYTGFMLNEILALETIDPAKAEQYAMAMHKAKQRINRKLVQGVFRNTFRSGKGVLAALVKWLSSITVGYARSSWLRRRNKKKGGGATDEKIESFFEMHKSRFLEMLKDLIGHLQSGIGGLPKEHFDELRERLLAEVRMVTAA